MYSRHCSASISCLLMFPEDGGSSATLGRFTIFQPANSKPLNPTSSYMCRQSYVQLLAICNITKVGLEGPVLTADLFLKNKNVQKLLGFIKYTKYHKAKFKKKKGTFFNISLLFFLRYSRLR